MADELPEGTDHIVPGAQNSSPGETPADDAVPGAGTARLRDQASAKAADLKGQAADKARAYAEEGKERAASGLDSVAKMISENASQIDERLGGHYGDYARKASDAVSDFSASLRDKDVEELLDDARDLVRRSPAIAIGAAAAAGFMIARIVKAGSEALDEAAKAAEPQTGKASSAAERDTRAAS